VGCGDIANKRVAPAILAHPRCELAAFCSGSIERARDFAGRHGAAAAFSDLDAFLAADLDCVYVASRVHQHAPQAIAALRAGKHVLCEKPMALNSAQCEAMLEAEAAAGQRLGVAYYRRFYPTWVRARQLAASGALGDVVSVRIWLTSFWRIPADDPKAWRLRPELAAAGPLADIGSHRLDLLVGLLDQPVSVAAFMATRHHDWQVEDAALVTMQMRCGAVAEAGVFANVGPRRDEFEVWGTEAAALLRPLDTTIEIVRGNETVTENLPPAANVHYPLVDDFVLAVETGSPLRCPGREGVKTTRIIEAALASAAEGRRIRL
jgi:predicted dehydrogenase